jgi:hypothetical protein
MIEPAKLSGLSDWHILLKENEGKNLFYINAKETSILLVYIKKYSFPISDVVTLWHIEYKQYGIPRRQIKKFYVGIAECSRDEFISHLSEKYPDYMEWFLFNNEWLD